MDVSGIFTAKDLASYINYVYLQLPNKLNKISPLKLQKSLYFCFAYWGGFVRKSKNNKSEIDLNQYSEYLFNDKIEAWVYGPVVPNVYRLEKLPDCNPDELFKDKEYIKEFIDGILNDVLKLGDFRLVELSHNDECWKKYFRKSELFHNNEIPKEEIIKEYAKQI